jgi:GH24 family phage-related lysozyme (muramidase)
MSNHITHKDSVLLVSEIKRHEALRLEAYRCPADVPTIGWGHTSGVKMGDVIDVQTAKRFLHEDIVEATRQAERVPGYALMDSVRKCAFIMVMFNLGPKFLTWPNTMRQMKNTARLVNDPVEHWKKVTAEMMDSKWIDDVKARSLDILGMIRWGRWIKADYLT